MKKIIFLVFLLLFPVNLKAHQSFTGATPALSSCGTAPTISGNDTLGVITIGTGTVTACTVTFATAWLAAPVCTTVTSTAILGEAITTLNTTTLTLGFSGSLAGGTVYYQCFGKQ